MPHVHHDVACAALADAEPSGDVLRSEERLVGHAATCLRLARARREQSRIIAV